jgi:hypothetical protein
MSINLIGAAIITLLQPLVNTGKVKQLDQFSSNDITGYPRVQVLSTGVQTEYLTNRERLITYNYDVVVTQEKTKENIGTGNAEVITDTLIQEMVQLFDGEINDGTPLSGTVDFIRPVETEETDSVEELAVIQHIIKVQGVKTV